MDQNKFINTYIDVIIGSLTEHVKANLQLQTQVKVNESVVAEKDQIIAALNQKLAANEAAEDWKRKYEAAEANYSASMSKLQHMNVLMSQIADMKKQILDLQSELEEAKQPIKKVINRKTKAKDESVAVVEEIKQETSTDDF